MLDLIDKSFDDFHVLIVEEVRREDAEDLGQPDRISLLLTGLFKGCLKLIDLPNPILGLIE